MSQSKHNHNSGLGNDPGHYEIIAYWKYTHRDWRFIPGILLRFAALFVFYVANRFGLAASSS